MRHCRYLHWWFGGGTTNSQKGSENMADPRIYLAVDNCFASKRWTRPSEWVELIRSMGVYYIEASADNECDPLYMSKEYMESWIHEVKEECRKSGVRVANLFSGHGSYATLGLAHTDKRIRDRFQNEWLKPMASFAAKVNGGIGFYCHAFSDSILQNPEAYDEIEQDLYRRLADIAIYCQDLGIKTPGVEQMYTPHQIPWTIEGSKKLLHEVFRLSRSPFYLTLDTGHQSGQRKFLRPGASRIVEAADQVRREGTLRSVWLGPKSAYQLFEEMIKQPVERQTHYMDKIEREMDRYPYLFANDSDGDSYLWFEELACYSPIIHLQQTTGTSSSHLPFSDEYNRNCIIFEKPLLQAISKAYHLPDAEQMPPKCGDLYLTLEIFSGTGELNLDIIHKIQDSIRYWRNYIPEDGMRLSEVVQRLG